MEYKKYYLQTKDEYKIIIGVSESDQLRDLYEYNGFEWRQLHSTPYDRDELRREIKIGWIVQKELNPDQLFIELL
jgi:hypothetical protein